MILNNLAVLYSTENEIDKAKEIYEEAIAIGKQLADINPKTYLPEVEMTLSNLAALHYVINKFEKAEKKYEEVITINK
jgi:tetratricopeptide (TPR) repeat protein